MKNTNTTATTATTITFSSYYYNAPERIKVTVFHDHIEIIYKETRRVTIYPEQPDGARVFKVIFSCIDGKWDESERIYGDVLPATDESYEFKD